MSSKLYRPGVAHVQPMAWPSRRDGSVVGTARPVEAKALQPSPHDDEWTSAVEQARKHGYAAGEAAGIAKGTAAASETLTPVLTSLTAVVQELVVLRPKVRLEAEAGTVDLAIAIARRVLHREIATDPEAILGLVRSAMDRLNARETHRLRLAPSDAATISEFRTRVNLPPALEIEGDAALESGSAIFETSRGEVDASIVTQLDEIQRGLTDVMRKRPRP